MEALRSDNEGEYVSNDFKYFCVKEDIRREMTTPQNPQQNVVVETKNHRIVGETRVMLHDQGLPLHSCVETCNTTIYL